MAKTIKYVLLAFTFISLSCGSVVAQGYLPNAPGSWFPGVITVIRDANIDDAAIDEAPRVHGVDERLGSTRLDAKF